MATSSLSDVTVQMALSCCCDKRKLLFIDRVEKIRRVTVFLLVTLSISQDGFSRIPAD